MDEFDNLLTGLREPGLPELRASLRVLLHLNEVSRVRYVESEKLADRVYRLRFELNGAALGVIVKLFLRISRADKLMRFHTDWIPRRHLDDFIPRLLTWSVTGNAEAVWHVYEDVGRFTLQDECDATELTLAAQTLAVVHSRFTDDVLLPSARLFGKVLGTAFLEDSVNDAVMLLASILSRQPPLDDRVLNVCDRLHDRAINSQRALREKADVLRRWGGKETLLHGDLWLQNIVRRETGPGHSISIVDWESFGVGSASYDLATLLSVVPPARRRPLLETYLAEAPGLFDDRICLGDWNRLFALAHEARLIYLVVWAAADLLDQIETSGREWMDVFAQQLEGVEEELSRQYPLLKDS